MTFNIFKVLGQVKELEVEKANLLTQLELSRKDLEEAQNTIGNFMVEKKEFDTKIETLNKEHQLSIEKLTVDCQNRINEIESQLASEKNSVNKQVAAVVASIGIEPDAIKESLPVVKVSVVKEFEKLEGKAQTEFYAKHKDAICKELGLIK